MCHTLQFLHDLIMDLCKIPRFWFTYSEIHESGIVIHLSEKTADVAHLALGVPVLFHDGVALLKVPCIFDNIVGIAWLCVLGLVSGGLPIRVLPFPGMVRYANGEPDPGKGAEDDPAVLDVHPFLVIQAEGPQITVDKEVQLGLWLRESGCRGIAN